MRLYMLLLTFKMKLHIFYMGTNMDSLENITPKDWAKLSIYFFFFF